VRPTARVCTLLVLVACVAGLPACGENSDQKAARDTVRHFYEALKTKDAATACNLLSPTLARAMLRGAGEDQSACVPGFRRFFRRVANSTDPKLFATVPSVDSALVRGDRAFVNFHQGYQRRRVALSRSGGHWRISGAPGLQ
jgi:ketosteroid isomerase-like protein